MSQVRFLRKSHGGHDIWGALYLLIGHVSRSVIKALIQDSNNRQGTDTSGKRPIKDTQSLGSHQFQ